MTTADLRELDSTDLQLACMLRRNPRITYEGMARRVGLSRPAVRTRVQRLRDFGAVRVTGVPHPRTRGLSVAAELLVDTSVPAGQVAAMLGDQTYLRTEHADGLMFISLWCSGDEELFGQADRLRALPKVHRVDVFRVVDRLRGLRTARVIEIDEIDRQLMDLLAEEPRALYSQLSDQIELSPAATRARVLRLLSSGALVFEVEVRTGLPEVSSRISVTVQGCALQVAHSLLEVPGLTDLAVGFGRHDILARLTTSPLEQHALYQRLRHMPGVDAVQIRQLTPLDV